jgi:2'-5' RNA ligase
MPFAVELELDPDAAGAAEAAMVRLEAYPGVETPRTIGMVPHLTLAVWGEIDPTFLPYRLAGFDRVPPPMRFSGFGLFAGPRAVLYLAPKPTAALLDYHADFHRAFADLDRQCWPYYRPSNWVPHVTLGEGLDAAALTALAALVPGFVPFTAQPTALGLIRFRPVERLFRMTLPLPE